MTRNSKITVVSIAVAMMITVVCGRLAAQLGPLDPPSGPIGDTTPSLQELADQIDDIRVLTTTVVDAQGPWESWAYMPVSSSDDQLPDAMEIAPGRVLVHKVIVFLGNVAVFDGEGTFSAGGIAATGDIVGRADGEWMSENSTGKGFRQTVEVELNVIVNNGLRIAYDARRQNSYVQVLYRPLDP